MMQRIKTIVCGSTFGQYYIDALKKYDEFFEVIGLLARGSRRSVTLAEKNGIPLFTDIDKIPENIVLACVVIRSEGVGGEGCEVAQRLMEKGIHIIQEQPIYPKNLMECYRTAKKYGVIYNIGNLYMKLPEVQHFIKVSRKLGDLNTLRYMSLYFCTQVAYPALSILIEAISGFREWKNLSVIKGNGPFDIITGQAGAIPITIEFNNKINPQVPDITYCSVKEREGAYENFNAVLEKWDDILLGNIKQKTIAGNHYTCMNVEHAVSLARVIISETGDDNLDDIKSEKEEVHFIVTEDCLEKNHFYIEYALYKRKESILCAMLRFLMDRGIFVNENQVYTFKEIKERINTLPENEEILRRWLKVLNSYGFIKEEANGFTALLKITEHFFETIWSQMEELWNGKLCNKLANEYLLKNIKALSELFSGEINPTHILFPEGKFDYAEALYKDTFIFQYLNTKIAQKIKEFLDATEHIEILELGAGTGATTDNVLPLIKERKNVIYYFSDISYVFLREAQHKYSEFRNIKYMTLNVNNLDLGKKVDIIIANGVLNNAKNIKYTLDKMLEITSEKGKIFIIEQVEESLEMLVSQVFMMKDSSALEEKGGKTFRNTEEWLRLLRDDRIEKIEVFPEKYNIDQRLFILYHK